MNDINFRDSAITFRVKIYKHFCHVTELHNIFQILIFIYNVKMDYSKEHQNHFTPEWKT